MIERFNFYDVYGYLIPGAVALSLFWLPFALAVTPNLPKTLTGATGAAVLAVLAYVTGQLLQMFAATILSERNERNERPSTYRIDRSPIREELAKAIEQRFPTIKILDERGQRDAAMLLCRSHLVAQGQAAYAEQQQGMYAFMRGISTAAAGAASFTAGWFLGSFFAAFAPHARQFAMGIGVGVLAILIFTVRAKKIEEKQRKERAIFATLLVTFAVAVGFACGSDHASYRWAMLALALVELLIALRTFRAYIHFAEHFVDQVYRDFLNLDLEQKPVQPGWRP